MSMDAFTIRDMFFATVDVAAGVPTIASEVGPDALAIVDNGVGDFTLTLPAGFTIPVNRTKVEVTPRSAIDAKYVYDEANSTAANKRVRCFDAAGAALDNIDFMITISFVMFGVGG